MITVLFYTASVTTGARGRPSGRSRVPTAMDGSGAVPRRPGIRVKEHLLCLGRGRQAVGGFSSVGWLAVRGR